MSRALRLAWCLGCIALLPTAPGCNAWRVAFPSSHHDSQPPALPAALRHPAVLVFTKTNGFRHEEAISAGLALFREVAARRGWSLFHTENGAVFNDADLAHFDVAVWHNTSGDVLGPQQRAAFVRFLESGGGFVGIHGAGGDPAYAWRWYVDELIGAQFIGHTMGPQFQQARVVLEAPSHPAARGLPDSWMHEEEWYSFDRSVRENPAFSVIASVDEGSYEPRLRMLWMDRDISMGDHPVVWSRCVGRGRALYSALGHRATAYASAPYARLLENAIAWAARVEGAGCG